MNTWKYVSILLIIFICTNIVNLSCILIFYKQGTIFPEPQICIFNQENQRHCMLVLCLYKYFISTFVDWLKENFLLCLHCDVLLLNVYHVAAWYTTNQAGLCALGMLTKSAILSLIKLARGMLRYFREDFLLRSQAKWVIFREVLYYYFHESTSLAVLTKNDLSITEKTKQFLFHFHFYFPISLLRSPKISRR